MPEREEKDQFTPESEEKEAEVTELDDKSLEDVPGGTFNNDSEAVADNGNCLC